MGDRVIGFTGPFADVNFGDYGMMVNNVLDLEPSSSVLFSYASGFLTSIRERYLGSRDVEIVDVRVNLSGTHAEGGVLPSTPVEILGCVVNLGEVTSAVERIDTLVVSGGGFVNGLWAMPHRIERLLSIFVPALVASGLGKPIVFTGNSYGPFGEHEEFFFALLNSLRNATFGARDSIYSCAQLRRLGIPQTSIVEVPDDLFLIHPSLRSMVPSVSFGGEYVVLETYQPVQYLREREESLRSFSSRMAERYGLEVVFLPFNLGQGGVDQAGYLSEVLDNFVYYDPREQGFLPLEDALGIISRARLVVASRYHAQVVALGVGTPVVAVLRDVLGDKRYYYGKCRGLLDRVLGDAPIDDSLYLQTDLTDALEVVSCELPRIVAEQSRQLGDVLPGARERLGKDRATLLGRV